MARFKNGIISCLIQILFFSTFVTHAQDIYFPKAGNEWEKRDPSTFGFKPEILQQAVNYALDNEYTGSRDLRIAILESFSHEPFHEIKGPVIKRGGPAGMILKNGYLIAEWGDIARVDMTFSVTKSYLSTVAGLAFDRGLLDPDDVLADFITDEKFQGKYNSRITWEHLLNQSSDWYGSLFGMYDWADRPPAEGDIENWRNRELHEPGTFFKYNDVRVNLLSYSLLQLWRKPLPVVLKEEIMDPIGASQTWRWHGYENSWVTVDGLRMQSVSGGGHSGGGIFINTMDHARFGLLFMNNGIWAEKRLLNHDWIRKAVSPSEANPSYGYMWWLNKGDRQIKEIPEEVFYAAGFGGNYIIIDQQNRLVIVTRWLEPSRLADFLKLVYKAL